MSREVDLAATLQAVIETAIDGIITIDQNGVIESVNHAVTGLFGYESEEMMGQKINMLMPRDMAEQHDHYIRRYQQTRVPHIIGFGREVQGKRKDGQLFPFRLAVSEVILNDRVIYAGVIHDLTDVVAAQEEVKEANKQLENKVIERTSELEVVVNKLLATNKELTSEMSLRKEVMSKLQQRETELEKSLAKEKELNELKSRFVSMASHEFRTPLSSILSSAALIGKYDQTEQQSKRDRHIDRIKSAVANLTGILNDFLSLSRLEEGAVAVDVSSFSLSELVASIREELAEMLKQDQQIQVNISPADLMINSDRRVLKNVLFNLISNAIKYSQKDILVDIAMQEDTCRIRVIDHGIGIPMEEQKFIFTRFFRASNVSAIQGTGLGLNIVQRYITLLRGDVSFVSAYNEGTTFTIDIPIDLK